jgi:hypothetical protein
MFSYYGSKSKIIHWYPRPAYNKIIEPFAGSAQYSLKYWDKEILLIDKYDVIVSIWKWLQQCSENDILKLPLLKQGMDIRQLLLSREELLFLSFLTNVGTKSPVWKVSPYAGKQFEQYGANRYKKIASNLYKIRHWKITHSSYEKIQNQEATWFVDAPYYYGGQYYRYNSKKIDYKHLAAWVQSRKGQVLVCENEKADWLPFKPMHPFKGQSNRTSIECIWSNRTSVYDYMQINLF